MLGCVYQDKQFEALFSRCDQPSVRAFAPFAKDGELAGCPRSLALGDLGNLRPNPPGAPSFAHAVKGETTYPIQHIFTLRIASTKKWAAKFNLCRRPSLGFLEGVAMVRLLENCLLQELGHFLLHTISLR
jgi:hypothetical protein